MAPTIDVATLHEAAAWQFDQTRRARGTLEHRIDVGGQIIRFRFAGYTLANALMPAIQHLECWSSERNSQLMIDVWESSEAPIRMEPHEWVHAVSPAHALGPRDFVYCQPDIGMLILFAGNRALICYRDLAEVPPWELAIPFRIVFNSWFQRFGGQVIHGAAVANANCAVILAGFGGAGKSSTALSCLDHPSLYILSDDLCLLQDSSRNTLEDAEVATSVLSPARTSIGKQENGLDQTLPSWANAHPVVCSLYNSIKIRDENLVRFENMDLPSLDHLPLDRGKPTFFLYPRYSEKLPRQRPVQALLLPRITNQPHTRISPATPKNAWRALVPSTFAVVMGDRETAAKNIYQLTRRLPVYWLDLGTDRQKITDVIHGFLCNPPTGAG